MGVYSLSNERRRRNTMTKDQSIEAFRRRYIARADEMIKKGEAVLDKGAGEAPDVTRLAGAYFQGASLYCSLATDLLNELR